MLSRPRAESTPRAAALDPTPTSAPCDPGAHSPAKGDIRPRQRTSSRAAPVPISQVRTVPAATQQVGPTSNRVTLYLLDGHRPLLLAHCSRPRVVTEGHSALKAGDWRSRHLGVRPSARATSPLAELRRHISASVALSPPSWTGSRCRARGHASGAARGARVHRAVEGREAGGALSWLHDRVVARGEPAVRGPLSAGVPAATLDQVLVCPPNDVKAVRRGSSAETLRG